MTHETIDKLFHFSDILSGIGLVLNANNVIGELHIQFSFGVIVIDDIAGLKSMMKIEKDISDCNLKLFNLPSLDLANTDVLHSFQNLPKMLSTSFLRNHQMKWNNIVKISFSLF